METPILPTTSPAPVDTEALFKEAKRNRRRRRAKGSAIVVIALLVVSLIGLLVAGGRGKSAVPTIPLSQPAFAGKVLKATRAAGGAAFTLVIRSPGLGCSSSTSSHMSVNHGSMDFVNHIMKYSTSIPGCPSDEEPLITIQTPAATYKDIRIPVGASASRPWLQTPSTVGAPVFSVGDAMLSADLATLLSAVTGPLVVGPSATIKGISTTEYRGSTTLAALQRDDPLFVPATGAGVSFVPDAASIKIPVQLWIDSKDQLVRASATEPYYIQAYPLGSEGGQALASGPQVSTTSNGVPPVAATTPPKLEGVARATLTLTDFSSKVIGLPSPSAIATFGDRWPGSPISSTTRSQH